MPHKHRSYTAEELETALEEGNVTLERLAATLLFSMPPARKVPAPAPQQAAKHEPVHGAKR